MAHVRIQRGTGVLSNTGSDPLKITKLYQSSIQCWAIIGPPAKRHLNDGPLIVVFGSFLPHQTKKKLCQSWIPTDKTFWIRACGQLITVYTTSKKSLKLAYVHHFLSFELHEDIETVNCKQKYI